MSITKRLLLLLVVFSAALLILPMRLFYLQVVRHDFYLSKSVDQRTRIIILAADRGDILDRNGNLLAASIDTCSVFAVPGKIKNKEAVAAKLSGILGIPKYTVLNMVYSDRPFVWVARKVDKKLGDRVRKAGLEGIGVPQEKKRVYPKGSIASQVIGFVGMDNQGLSGIELGFDKYLKGVEGRLVTESDPRGRELVGAHAREIQSPTEGLAVVLTIDETVQYIAERELKAAIGEHGADAATIIVMDVKSGEILAMASKPDFDPNRYLKYSPSLWQSGAVLDVYEPGSTFKLVTVAAALEDGAVGLKDRIKCPPQIKIGGRTIRNAHRLKDIGETATVSEIITHSINTGTSAIAMELGEKKLHDYIRLFGFGERTNVGIPGETRGIVRDVENWSKPDIATISFGQGIAVTPLQMLSAVATIANGGRRVKPSLVKRIESVDRDFVKTFPRQDMGRVISEKTADDVKKMMRMVVEEGTGKYAKIAGFSVGGKTGTAQKVRPGGGGYWPGHYIASFAGVAPLSDPGIAIIVTVDDPKGVHWGEKVAAPVFKRVAEETLRYLNVPPDLI